jgi:catechol 2,3-dioxygenase-like lactoylglutathione lyase family enzyme
MTSRPVFSQLNIVVRDMDAAVRFYRMLGLDISSTVGDWPPGSGARHVDGHPNGGAHLDLDNAEMTRIWAGQALEPGAAVIGFCRAPGRPARLVMLTTTCTSDDPPPGAPSWVPSDYQRAIRHPRGTRSK